MDSQEPDNSERGEPEAGQLGAWTAWSLAKTLRVTPLDASLYKMVRTGRCVGSNPTLLEKFEKTTTEKHNFAPPIHFCNR